MRTLRKDSGTTRALDKVSRIDERMGSGRPAPAKTGFPVASLLGMTVEQVGEPQRDRITFCPDSASNFLGNLYCVQGYNLGSPARAEKRSLAMKFRLLLITVALFTFSNLTFGQTGAPGQTGTPGSQPVPGGA